MAYGSIQSKQKLFGGMKQYAKGKMAEELRAKYHKPNALPDPEDEEAMAAQHHPPESPASKMIGAEEGHRQLADGEMGEGSDMPPEHIQMLEELVGKMKRKKAMGG